MRCTNYKGNDEEDDEIRTQPSKHFIIFCSYFHEKYGL